MARAHQHPALPTRDGVSASCVALTPGPWHSLLEFLTARFPRIHRDQWAERFAQGLIFNAQGQPVEADAPCLPHTRLYYFRSVPQEPALPFEAQVLFQDAHLVVADKPHFMPVTPAGRYVQQSLLVQLKQRLGLDTLTPVHRIDRETAGLVLFSVQAHERNAYQALFRERQVHKVYEAVAAFNPTLTWPMTRQSRLESDTQFFRSREVAGPPNSETHLSVLHTEGQHALYRLEPVTGQRHQLRVHMNALGLPIEGDQFYPTVLRGPDEAEDFSAPLQLLAKHMAFTDPITGEERVFHSAQRLRLAL
jgi:tRNA pseudouridine32 synthase/23S rRNA pseudouridine746 synthase